MYRLMRIELEKTKGGIFGKLAISWLIVTAVCLAMFLLMMVMTKGIVELIPEFSREVIELKDVARELIAELTPKVIVDMIIGSCFLVYGGVNFAQFVVSDYRRTRLEQLFTYPISRRKIMYAKITLATLITVIGCVLTKVLLYSLVYLLDPSFSLSGIEIIEIFTTALALGFMSHVAMAVGIWRKSVIATIVTACILVTVSQGNIGVISMQDFPAISYGIALIGMLITARYINKINRLDFFN